VLAGTVTASLDFVRPLGLHREEVDMASLVEEALIRAPLPRALLRTRRLARGARS
jgi:hypothetical protein